MKLRPANNNSWWAKWCWVCIGAFLGCILFWVLVICAIAGVFS